jgi:hypothetical protein
VCPNACYHSVQNLPSSSLLSKYLITTIYKTIILPVLRGIFEPRGDEVTGGWRKLHNEELRDLYFSQSIIRLLNSSRGG